MKLNKLLQNSYRLIMALVIAAVAFPSSYGQLNAADLPVLSLTGADNGSNQNWYPDGRLVLAPSPVGSEVTNSYTQVLVPVFIKLDPTSTENINSFNIKLKYDARFFQPVGVQSFHPTSFDSKYAQFADENDYLTVGSDFQFAFHTYNDPTYTTTTQFLPNNSMAIRVIGTSSKPLKNMNGQTTFKPFFYVKMNLLTTALEANPEYQSYLMIDADSILFNDNLRTVGAPNYNNVAGSNGSIGIQRSMLGVFITQKRPEIGFYREPLFTGATLPIRSIVGKVEYELVDPITVDIHRDVTNEEFRSDIGDYEVQRRTVWINNLVNGTRLNEIYVESDQPWLRVKWGAQTEYYTTNYIPWIDRVSTNSSVNGQELTIECNPNLIQPEKDEVEGTYVGYLTFRSKDGLENPTKLKVTFIVLRPAYEPHLYAESVPAGQEASHRGIVINVGYADNSDVKQLVFGVAPRATNEIDTLMGERPASNLMATFDARWVPVDAALKAKYPHGFVDGLPDITRPDYNSRDIRSIDDTQESIVYMCRFNTPRYPLVVSWDINDFPEGAILYLKDSATRGTRIAMNMREGNPVPNTGLLSYTFNQDANMNNFIIEYTLPKVISFIDESGRAIIKKGWNMLSLPVRPSNPSIAVVYPNSMNRNALVFFPSGWEQTEKTLVPGEGFFIRYNNFIDSNFSGAKISQISPEYGDKVRIFNGWNLIGALSVPTAVSNISFVNRTENAPADIVEGMRQYVKKYDYYAYEPDKGYYPVNNLLPGLGYFIKVGYKNDDPANKTVANNIEAYLKITPNTAKAFANDNSDKYSVLNNSTEIKISDNAQKSTSVYLTNDTELEVANFEMPPVFGDYCFDARFNNNTKISKNEKSMLQLNAVDYPISLTAKNADSDLFFYDAMTNELLGVIAKNSGKNIEVKSTRGNKINVVKSDIEFNAYPNPVVSSAKVNYTVPEEGMVTVKLFDALGNEVAVLVNSYLTANNYTVDMNAANLTSGTYLLKVNVGNYSAVRSITVVK